MIPEIGHFLLWLALGVALILGVMPLIGAQRNNPGWMALARPSAYLLFALVVAAFICLIVSFVRHDFSVLNVASNSNSALPLAYRIAASWGSHEGSLLLWVLMLSGWLSAVATFSEHLPRAVLARTLSVMGLVAVGFLLFLLLTSNPFERLFPVPLDGRDLNPLLQDPGMVFHPPLLYMGYVGFSVAFAFAISALIGGNLDATWARWTRPWTTLAWMFLTVGIALGSWWAYYELGWGGWWFWDPVENASLLPWLTGTALLHSLLVLEARGALKRWTILLAVVSFSLSLLGTFLVRSGVLSSVHAFAVDPLRGTFILMLLSVYCGGAFSLYALRAPMLKTIRLFTPVSRESGIVVNNMILVTMAATVLTGTLYPLLMDALGLAQLSVGAPYYNATVVMMAIPLFILMGAGPMLPWKRPGRWLFVRPLGLCAVIAIAATLISGIKGALPMVGFGTAVWVMASSLSILWVARKNITLKTLAMSLGHFGLGLAVIGMMGTMLWKTEDIRVLNPGDTYTVGRYDLRFDGVRDVFGPNYGASEATITLGAETLHPQKRWYPVSESETTESAIRLTALDDLYIVLGERDLKFGPDAWVIRTTIHPFVSTLWAGFSLVVLSGLCMLGYSFKRKRAA